MSTFHIKEVQSEWSSQPIVLQNENGPCALLAIVNTLILKDSPMASVIQSQLKEGVIGEELLLSKIGELVSPNNEEQLEELFHVLPLLSEGLDVNPKFNGEFEGKPTIFESLNIQLHHGWVLGSQELQELGVTSECDRDYSDFSYEQYCESEFNEPILILKYFIDMYKSQLTHSGYRHLRSVVPEGDMVVLFWNNHFSTITKHNNELYTLVTDLGLLKEPNIVWEKVDMTGAGVFVNGNFEASSTNNT